MKELSAIATGGSVATSGGSYSFETPVLTDLNPGLESNQRLKLSFKPVGGDAIAGTVNLDAWAAEIRKDKIVKKVEVRRNDIKGTLRNGVLNAVAEIQLAVVAEMGGQQATGTMTAHTTLTGKANAAGNIPGQANTQMSLAVTGEQAETAAKQWSFTALRSGGGGKMALLAPDNLSGAFAAPGQGFQTAACKIAPGIIGSGFQKDVVGVLELDRGGSHFFSLAGRNPNMMLDAKSGRFTNMPGTPVRKAGDVAQWYAGPGGVLESAAVGDGVRVTAVGDGMGEVWARSLWDCKMPDGTVMTGALTSIWVVPVGAQARNQVGQSRTGGTAPDTTYAGETVGPVTISGQVILKNGEKPVAGALVFLWREGGGAYHKPEWVTGSEGSFRISAMGLIPGTYEVMVQKRAANVNLEDILGDNERTFVDDDLWPVLKYMIDINKQVAAKGEIVMPLKIRLVPIKEMNWERRIRAG